MKRSVRDFEKNMADAADFAMEVAPKPAERKLRAIAFVAFLHSRLKCAGESPETEAKLKLLMTGRK